MRLWSLSTRQRLIEWVFSRYGAKVCLRRKCSWDKRRAIDFILNLIGFASENWTATIGAYLWAVLDEARSRGYNFDASRIATERLPISISVTRGQLDFERQRLMKKLRTRDQDRFRILGAAVARPHPILRVVAGGLEPWEVA